MVITYKKVTIRWCSYACIFQAKGAGYVKLRFDPGLKKYLLELKRDFTVWGNLRAIISLKNHYSLRIYQLLKFQQGRNSYQRKNSEKFELTWLKKFLSIAPEQYKLFGHFKHKILDPAREEISRKTDIKFDYEHIKLGRKIHALKLSWKHNQVTKNNEKLLSKKELTTQARALIKTLVSQYSINTKAAIKLTSNYDKDRITKALIAADEYCDNLRKQGQKTNLRTPYMSLVTQSDISIVNLCKIM